jgi:hypothetical protein
MTEMNVELKCNVWAEEVTPTPFGRQTHSCHAQHNGLDGHTRLLTEINLNTVPPFIANSKGKWQMKKCMPDNHDGEECGTCPWNPKTRFVKLTS